MLTTLTLNRAFTLSFQAQNSSLSTNLFHHSLLEPMAPDCLLGLYWIGLILLNGFHF